jgi:hypothetical protein
MMITDRVRGAKGHCALTLLRDGLARHHCSRKKRTGLNNPRGTTEVDLLRILRMSTCDDLADVRVRLTLLATVNGFSVFVTMRLLGGARAASQAWDTCWYRTELVWLPLMGDVPG